MQHRRAKRSAPDNRIRERCRRRLPRAERQSLAPKTKSPARGGAFV